MEWLGRLQESPPMMSRPTILATASSPAANETRSYLARRAVRAMRSHVSRGRARLQAGLVDTVAR